MTRLHLTLAVCLGVAAAAPAVASAAPPQAPPGCSVVITTPAAVTGSPQALANKMEAYTRVCLS